ncbi:MAG TPA: SH3 domain-containing protein [Polyangiaceae bacterium]|jgi:hypothetical protein
MLSRKADGPLTVQIPGPAEDRPSWTRVGVIAAIGFVVGVAWPRLAGVRLGPSVPEVATASAAAPASPDQVAALPTGAAPAAPGSTTLPAAVVAPAPAAPAPATVNVAVGHGVVFGCKTSDGDSLKGGDCGSLPGLDGIVMPRLRKLAECPEAVGASGKLHLVLHIDFPRGGIGVDLGRGHGVSSPDALLACAKTAMTGAAPAGVAHDNPRYSVAYSVTFTGEGASAPSASAASARPAAGGGDATEGTAQVVWEVAIVRDAPKTGKVVARLQHGAELHLGPVKDGWYPVKFGDGFTNDGWVYRGAIGR